MRVFPTIRGPLGVTLGLLLMILPIGCGTTPSTDNGAKGNGVSAQLEKGKQLAEQGLDDEAIEAFSLALQENPRLIEAHMGIGSIHLKQENYQQASSSYQRAVNIDPGSFDAHYYLGLARQLLGQVKSAIRSYQQAVAIKPTDFKANMNLASALLQNNQPREALPYAEKAIDLDPTVSAAYANVAAAYSLLGRYDEAVQAYRDAMELGTPEEPILLGLADAHLRLGNYERAVNVLRRLTQDSQSPTVMERFGYAQFKTMRYDAALETYRTGLAAAPKDISLLNGYGVCLMTHYLKTKGDVPEYKNQAISSWRQSLKIQPNQPRITDLINRYNRVSDHKPKRPKRDDPFDWE